METNMKFTLWVIMHDPETQRTHDLDPLDFPEGATRYIVAKALEVWKGSRSMLTPAILENLLGNDDTAVWGTTKDEIIDLYDDLYYRYEETEADIQGKRTIASKYLRTLRSNRSIDEAQDALEKGDLDAAEEALGMAKRAVRKQQGEMVLDKTSGPVIRVRQRPAIPTGIRMLDKWWKGGIHLGQLGVVLAPPNVGKSMMLPNYTAEALKASKNVLYYSTELPEYEVYQRTLSSLAHEPISKVDPEEAVARMQQLYPDLGHLSIRFRDTGTLTTVDIEVDMEEKRKAGVPIHLVILDGDDIGVAGKVRNEKLYDLYFYTYGQLAGMVQHTDVAVWTAAQATRTALEARYVGEKHVADSMWKLRRADLMVALGAGPNYKDKNEIPFMRMFVLKDRYYGTKGRSFGVYPKWGYKGAVGAVGFDAQPDTSVDDDPFEFKDE